MSINLKKRDKFMFELEQSLKHLRDAETYVTEDEFVNLLFEHVGGDFTTEVATNILERLNDTERDIVQEREDYQRASGFPARRTQSITA